MKRLALVLSVVFAVIGGAVAFSVISGTPIVAAYDGTGNCGD